MKHFSRSLALAVASVVVLTLSACEPVMSEESAQMLVAQSEILRKNGNFLIEQGKAIEAIEVFDTLIALDPQNALAYNGKGVAFDYTGNHLAAQELYQTALSFAPDSITIKNNLAMSLILNQQIDQAIILLESLVNVPNDNEASKNTIRHNLAMAYGISGQTDKANKLNLQNLTPEQAKENMRFYERYISRNSQADKGKNSATALTRNNHHIGFITTESKVGGQSSK